MLGLFGPPKHYRRREFSMPCSPEEAMAVIFATPSNRQDNPLEVNCPYGQLEHLDIPPLVEGIYIQNLGPSGFDIVAGNRVKTYWRLRLTLVGSATTQGSLEAVEVNDSYHWSGNVLDLVFTLARAIESTGGTKGKWPL